MVCVCRSRRFGPSSAATRSPQTRFQKLPLPSPQRQRRIQPTPARQVTHNRSLDGVLDRVSSKSATDAGPLQLIDHDAAAASDDELLPPSGSASDAAGARLGIGAGAAGKKRPAARVRALALSPTGQSWAAATTEGVLLYGLDNGAAFDPTDLSESLTPAAFRAALAGGAYVRALLIALRLADEGLLRHGLLSVPPAQVRAGVGWVLAGPCMIGFGATKTAPLLINPLPLLNNQQLPTAPAHVQTQNRSPPWRARCRPCIWSPSSAPSPPC